MTKYCTLRNRQYRLLFLQFKRLGQDVTQPVPKKPCEVHRKKGPNEAVNKFMCK